MNPVVHQYNKADREVVAALADLLMPCISLVPHPSVENAVVRGVHSNPAVVADFHQRSSLWKLEDKGTRDIVQRTLYNLSDVARECSESGMAPFVAAGMQYLSDIPKAYYAVLAEATGKSATEYLGHGPVCFVVPANKDVDPRDKLVIAPRIAARKFAAILLKAHEIGYMTDEEWEAMT